MFNRILPYAAAFIILLALILFLSKTKDSGKGESDSISQNISTITDNKKSNSAMSGNRNTYSSPPEMQIDKLKSYHAVISTSKGDLNIRLFADETPVTVNNFVFLAREGFYDQTIFHRIIKDFMIQGGDPAGDGTGGPGYKFADEPVKRDYIRGTLAMANSGKDTNGSQFFIMHKDYPLPKNYVIFGKIDDNDEESFLTLDKIAATPVTNNSQGEASLPTETVIINKVEIIE